MTKTNGNICFVTDEFLVDPSEGKVIKASASNTCEENRILFCTTLASVSRGKALSANPSVRYRALLKEAAPSINDLESKDSPWRPSRPIEFIGVRINGKIGSRGGVILDLQTQEGNHVDFEYNYIQFCNRIARFSYITRNEDEDSEYPLTIYTNLRALLNAGVPYHYIPYNTEEELRAFKAVRVRAPMFVFNQLVTHTALSKEARSERVVNFFNLTFEGDLDFPDPFKEVFWMPESVFPHEFFELLHHKSQVEVMRFLKDEKNLPKEIYQRAILEWRYKDFMLVGWDNEYTWRHLFLERSAMEDVYKNWTQHETKETVKTIKEVIDSEPGHIERKQRDMVTF